jgi:hypothetical protein
MLKLIPEYNFAFLAKSLMLVKLVSIRSLVPMDHIVIDSAGPFHVSANLNTYVLLAVDVSTRFVWLLPLPDDKACASQFFFSHSLL